MGPIPLQVCFEFRVFFLLDLLAYQNQKVSLPYYLPIVVRKIVRFIPLLGYVKCKESRSGFEFEYPYLLPTLVTVAL